MKKMRLTTIVLAALIAGCTTNPETGESQLSKGALYGGIGTVGGAVVGALAGGKKGAFIGAALGGTAGAGYGVYTDIQEKKLREQLQDSGVEVQRNGENIVITMPGNVTFEKGSANMSSGFYKTLNSITTTLKEYDKTTIKVVGHTDNTGNFETNQKLSEQRASSVAEYLVSQGIEEHRVHHFGLGSREPVATNDTEDGRQTNRRVEIEIKNTPKN
jgi:outer membrane protein OmpA-like peptidoglycan-associated protein